MTNRTLGNHILSFLFIGLTFSCSQPKESTEATAENQVVTEAEVVEQVELPAVCIWDKVSVKEEPGAKAKFITSMSIGESVKYLGKDSTVEDRTYTYVGLNDGKEGWAIKDFVVENAKPAVILFDVSFYTRPDLLTKSDKVFKMMDIVSSIEVQGEWMKIKGRRSGAKWMDEGWVKTSNVSFDAVDIATAKFASAALSKGDDQEKIEAIDEVLGNVDLSDSKFIAAIEKAKSELMTSEEPAAAMDAVEEVVESDSID